MVMVLSDLTDSAEPTVEGSGRFPEAEVDGLDSSEGCDDGAPYQQSARAQRQCLSTDEMAKALRYVYHRLRFEFVAEIIFKGRGCIKLSFTSAVGAVSGGNRSYLKRCFAASIRLQTAV
jgi:hypothetical protein